MSADEEYLDNLLKSVTEGIEETEVEPEIEPETEQEAEPEIALDLGEEEFSFDIDAMLKELDLVGGDSMTETTGAEEQQEVESLEESESRIPDQIFIDNMPDFTEEDIERMLEESQDISSDFSVPEIELEIASPDVDEINSLLEKADNNEAVTDEVFDLFAGMSAIGADTETEIEEPIDILGEINERDSKRTVSAQKKAEKNRKRQEKLAEKAAKKSAKLAEKERKKQAKTKPKVTSSDELVLFEALSGPDEEWQEGASVDNLPEETPATGERFEAFVEEEEYTDIDDLLSSLSLDDFSEAPVPQDSETQSVDDGAAVQSSKEETQKQKGKKERGKKEKIKPEGKKKSFFGKVFDFLTEEGEEEEETSKNPGNIGQTDINAENDAIMEELAKEDKKAKKADKKGKKNKKEDKKSDKKKKKEKKSSDMSKQFKPIDESEPDKKVGKNGIFVVLLIAVSVFAVVLLTDAIFSPILAKQRAKAAFANQDYETCYLEFSGWDLNDVEKEMQEYSFVIMKMDYRITAYEQYRELRKKPEALDALLRAVKNYDEIYQEALNCGAETEVEARYDRIIGILEEEYHLSKEDAIKIASLSSDVEYTRYITELIEGKDITGTFKEEEEIPGLLPEEEELPDTKFSE